MTISRWSVGICFKVRRQFRDFVARYTSRPVGFWGRNCLLQLVPGFDLADSSVAIAITFDGQHK